MLEITAGDKEADVEKDFGRDVPIEAEERWPAERRVRASLVK
ncbi:hypothetical protein [Paraburkholderia elongata]|nr:hypothetical protein [Paraburkholderia elongata]